MGLVDEVLANRDKADYRSRECMESRRAQLQHNGRFYCLLSRPDEYHYCPLQGVEGEKHLFECRRTEYLKELESRTIKKG
ncbi:hypothetical protein ACFL3V_03890 [Nanoarchaeota archaeon]